MPQRRIFVSLTNKKKRKISNSNILQPVEEFDTVRYVTLFPGNANEMKFTHNLVTTSGTLVVKFHRLKLFGFFAILERVRRVGCPISGQVALFPDDHYEINTLLVLGNNFLDD